MAKLYFKVASDWEEVVKLRNEIAKLKQELKGMDSTQSPAAFKALNTQLSVSTQRMDELVSEAAKAGAVMEGDFKKKIFDASQVVNGLSEKITLQRGTIQQLKNELSGLKDKYRETLKQDGDTSSLEAKIKSTSEKLREQKGVLFNLTQEQAGARLSVKKLRDEYELFKDDGDEVKNSISGIADSMKGWAATIAGGIGIKEFIGKMVKVRGQFQAADTAIQTLLGSKEKADALMSQVREYAKISPLEFSDVTSATQMMLGFNIEAEKVPRYLQAIGDVSMGDTQKFNSLTLAFSQMSAAGKLMGQDLNQMINAGFNPLQQISEKTGKSIATLKEEMPKGAVSAEMVQQAFIDATSAGGRFCNMSENASKTINGQLSMMQDAMDAAFNEMGQKSEGVIIKGIQMTTSLIQNYETVGKVLAGLVVTYGTYRTAVMLATAAENGHSAATMIMRGRILMAQKAQALLNATMLKNPYVLLATVAIGAASAIFAFSKRTTEAQKAQERYNAAKEDAIRKEEAHRQEIQRLISVAEDEAEATANRNAAIESLKKAYPGIIEKYIDEEGHLTNLIQLQKDLNEEQSKRKAESNQQKLASINTKVRNQEEYVSRMSGSEEAVKEANDVLIELQRQQKEAQSAVNADYINARIEEAKKLSDDKLKKAISQWKSSLSKVTGEMIGEFSRDEISAFIKSLETLQSAREKQAKNKKYWEGRKKEAETARDALDVSKKNSEEWKKYTKQIQEAQTQIDKYSSPSKQQKDADKQLKQQEQLSEQLLSLRRKNQQDEINLMKEGTKKKLAKIDADFDAQKQAIKKQARELAKANKEAGITDVNASGLTAAQQAEIDKANELNKEARKKTENDLYKAQIEKYQSYADQRLAIEKKYNDDIAVLQEARKKAENSGNAVEVARLESSIAKATAEKGKELMKHDFDVLKQSPEYIRAFEDLRNTSTETLNSLLQQLQEAKNTAATVLNPEDLREYTTTIQEIMDELEARNPFNALADRQKELAEAQAELAEAKRQLEAVNKGAQIIVSTSIGKDGKIVATYLSAAEALQNYTKAKDKSEKANNNFIKAEKTAKDKVDELAGAIQGLGSAIGGQAGEIISLMGDVSLFATSTIEGIGKVAQTGANAISAVEKASVILGIISGAVRLLQKISELGNNKAFKEYEAYAEKIKEINALTDAVNDYRIAALEASQAEAGWFSSDNLQNLRDYRDLHDEVFEAYKDKANEQQAIYQNKSGGGWLTGAINWVMGNLSLLSPIKGWRNLWGQGGYDEGMTSAINNLRIETRKASSGFLGSGIGGKSQKTEDLATWARKQGLGELFDKEGLINKELAQSLIDNYGNKLVGQTKETLDALIELREQYDEYMEQLHEYVSSLYEPLVDNFVDSIWDWLDTGKDALSSFKEYASDTFKDIADDMLKSIVLSKIFGEGENSYQSKINAIYDDYAKGLIDEVELNRKVQQLTAELMRNAESQLPAIQGIAENISDTIKETTGIDITGSDGTTQQGGSQRGYTTISQDTGEELNGRFTALQVAGEEIKNQSVIQSQSLNLLTAKTDAILSINTESRNIADDTRDLIAQSYLELVQISENTGAIVKPIQQIQKDIAEVKRNTSKL